MQEDKAQGKEQHKVSDTRILPAMATDAGLQGTFPSQNAKSLRVSSSKKIGLCNLLSEFGGDSVFSSLGRKDLSQTGYKMRQGSLNKKKWI